MSTPVSGTFLFGEHQVTVGFEAYYDMNQSTAAKPTEESRQS